MYKTFEIFLENVSFIVLLISMLIYWIQVSNLESFQFASLREATRQDSPSPPTGTYRPPLQGEDSISTDQPSAADVDPTKSCSLGSTSAALGVSCGMSLPTGTKKKRNENGHFLREILPAFLSPTGEEKQTKPNLAGRLSDIIRPSFQYFPASIGILISNLSIFILLVLRWNESGHFPLSNLYESLMFLSWSLTFIHLFIEVIIFSGSKRPFFNLKTPYGEKTSFLASLNTYSVPKEDRKTDPLYFLGENVWLPKVRFFWDIRKIRESYDLGRQSPQRVSVACYGTSALQGIAIPASSLDFVDEARKKGVDEVDAAEEQDGKKQKRICNVPCSFSPCVLPIFSPLRGRSEYLDTQDGKKTKNKGGTSPVGSTASTLRMSPYKKKGSCGKRSVDCSRPEGVYLLLPLAKRKRRGYKKKKKNLTFFPSYSCSAGMGLSEAKKQKKISPLGYNIYPTPSGGCPIEYRGCAKPPGPGVSKMIFATLRTQLRAGRKGVSFLLRTFEATIPNAKDQQRKSATGCCTLSKDSKIYSGVGFELLRPLTLLSSFFFFFSPCGDSVATKKKKDEVEERSKNLPAPQNLRGRSKNEGIFRFPFGVAFRKKEKKKLINKLIGSITAPCALFTNAFATFSLPKEIQESSFLVPALQSNWLMMHVTVMILSYAALILGSLLSIGFLVITGVAGIGKLNTEKSINSRLSAPGGKCVSTKKKKYKIAESIAELKRLNLAKTLDNLSYRMLGLGFPLLTIGILSGAVWANEAWGSYWSWDPKETWALLTWLVFAIYLHSRLTKGWQGTKPAIIASFGFITVWICFLGVNLIGEGLHSYGWVS